MATPDEILRSMGLDPETAERRDAELTINAKTKDRRICLCGHSVGRHDMALGRPVCQVGKLTCACRNLTPVITASDTRPFIRKTEGSAMNHALARGIAAARTKDITVERIDEAWYCHKCEARGESVRLTPMAMTRVGAPADFDSGYNAFFCDNCRIGG